MGIIGMIELRTHTSHLKLLTSDLSNVCGVFALSFFIHNLITTILKNNEHQENNKRDVLISYIFTGCIYATLGIFGGFSIAKYETISSAQTVLTYYTANVATSYSLKCRNSIEQVLQQIHPIIVITIKQVKMPDSLKTIGITTMPDPT